MLSKEKIIHQKNEGAQNRKGQRYRRIICDTELFFHIEIIGKVKVEGKTI